MKQQFFSIGLICLLAMQLFSAEPQTRFVVRSGGPSRQNLISSSQVEWRQDSPNFRSESTQQAASDSIRILALMVQFQPDEDDKTTGDGLFDLSDTDALILDPPPHDRSYFEHHLLGLRHYYLSVSRGRLRIGFDVYPEVFDLPNTMATYNPATSETATDIGLASLFYETIQAGDNAGVVFSDYDAFIVFHAGVGRDIDLGLDFSEKDIPSAFLNLEDLRKNTAGGSSEFQGIPVENGTFFITEGLILPETESQEGYEIGLLGTAALMFGFQLGLPALWNTETGVSGIGRWGLMDQGSGNYTGMIPAEPCAWSKIFLGWEKPVTLSRGTDLKVACSKASGVSHIYKIPINDHEYFLIENRQYDPNGDGVARGKDAAGRPVTFTETGQLELSEKIGVITEVDEYDYGLPGSGILIWHIDESVLLRELADNTVNNDKDHRAVDLEEADGAQDIGEVYGFLQAGAGAESGVLHDAFFEDNEINTLVNESETVAFRPKTHPNSKSYSGANSHIVVEGFSLSDTVMTFSVSNDLLMTGFPQYFPAGLTPWPPLYGDLDGDGLDEIVVATREGKVFVWRADGSVFVENNPMDFRISVTGDTLYYESALFADMREDLIVPPIVTDGTGEGFEDVVVAYRGIIEGFNGWGDKIYFSSPPGVVTSLISVNGQLIAGDDTGLIASVSCVRDAVPIAHLEAPVVSISQAGPEQIAASSRNGTVLLVNLDGSDPRSGTWFDSPSEAILSCAPYSGGGRVDVIASDQLNRMIRPIADSDLNWPFLIFDDDGVVPLVIPVDINSDGMCDLVFVRQGQIHVTNRLASLDPFPIPWVQRDIRLSDPVVGDVDGDGSLDILVTTSQGKLEGYSSSGLTVNLSVGSGIPVIPTLCDLDADEDIDCITISDSGLLHVWDFSGKYSEDTVPWGSYLHDPQHTGYNSTPLRTYQAQSDFFPTEMAYNYPNPNIENFTIIRYRLEQPATVRINIFNLAGELIESLPGNGLAPADNEVKWYLDDVDSGVYFCQVHASGSAGNKTATFKIAVVK